MHDAVQPVERESSKEWFPVVVMLNDREKDCCLETVDAGRHQRLRRADRIARSECGEAVRQVFLNGGFGIEAIDSCVGSQ